MTTNLTNREVQILEMLANGLQYKDIAETLGNTANAVKKAAHETCYKLGADNRTHAVALAIRRKIIE